MKIRLNVESLARVVANVATCAETNRTLPALCAVYVSRNPDSGLVELAATDRYRLAVATFSADAVCEGETPVLVDAKSLQAALAMVAKTCGKSRMVSIDFESGVIDFGQGELPIEKLSYSFPNWRDGLLPEITESLPGGVFPIASESLAALAKFKFSKHQVNESWVIRFTGDGKPFAAERQDTADNIAYRVWVMPRKGH